MSLKSGMIVETVVSINAVTDLQYRRYLGSLALYNQRFTDTVEFGLQRREDSICFEQVDIRAIDR